MKRPWGGLAAPKVGTKDFNKKQISATRHRLGRENLYIVKILNG